MSVSPGPNGFSVEAIDIAPAPSRDDPLGDRGYLAVKFSGGISAPYNERSATAMLEAAAELVDAVATRVAVALKLDPSTRSMGNPIGLITVDELLARGCSDDLEGRALDVVLRCGWPRPGDPLGIKPCIPIEMRALKRVVEVIDLDDQRKPAAKLKEVRDFLHGQLRHQEYVRTLYLRTVEGEAGGS